MDPDSPLLPSPTWPILRARRRPWPEKGAPPARPARPPRGPRRTRAAAEPRPRAGSEPAAPPPPSPARDAAERGRRRRLGRRGGSSVGVVAAWPVFARRCSKQPGLLGGRGALRGAVRAMGVPGGRGGRQGAGGGGSEAHRRRVGGDAPSGEAAEHLHRHAARAAPHAPAEERVDRAEVGHDFALRPPRETPATARPKARRRAGTRDAAQHVWASVKSEGTEQTHRAAAPSALDDLPPSSPNSRSLTLCPSSPPPVSVLRSCCFCASPCCGESPRRGGPLPLWRPQPR